MADKYASAKGITVSEFGGPEVLKHGAVAVRAPGENEVVVRMRAAGVNPVDTYIRNGAYGRLPALPYTPGGDGAGEVVEVGAAVKRFKVGDRVWKGSLAPGSYSQYMTLDADTVQPLPDGLSYAQGCAINVAYGTAYRALVQRAKVKPSDTVLVHGGSGGVGVACIQICRYLGVNVHATAGSEEGLDLVRSYGASHAFNHRIDGYAEQMKAEQPGGYDVIVEMLANVNLQTDLGLLARDGRVAVVGSRGKVEIDPRGTMAVDGAVLGVAFGLTSAEDLAELHAFIGAGLRNGALQPVVGKQFALSDAASAHVYIMDPGTRAQGKVWLDCDA